MEPVTIADWSLSCSVQYIFEIPLPTHVEGEKNHFLLVMLKRPNTIFSNLPCSSGMGMWSRPSQCPTLNFVLRAKKQNSKNFFITAADEAELAAVPVIISGDGLSNVSWIQGQGGNFPQKYCNEHVKDLKHCILILYSNLLFSCPMHVPTYAPTKPETWDFFFHAKHTMILLSLFTMPWFGSSLSLTWTI